MKSFLWMVLAGSILQIAIFLIVEGFKQSYWGKNCIQEITRFINSFCKHYRKMKVNNDTNKDL
jgi:hypothetical protein